MQAWMIYVGPSDPAPRFPEGYTATTGDPMSFLSRFTGAADDGELGRLASRSHRMNVGDSDQIRTTLNTVAGSPGVVRIVRTQ